MAIVVVATCPPTMIEYSSVSGEVIRFELRGKAMMDALAGIAILGWEGALADLVAKHVVGHNPDGEPAFVAWMRARGILSDGPIPKEIVDAAELVGRYFAGRNIKSWMLGPCASREIHDEAIALLRDALSNLRVQAENEGMSAGGQDSVEAGIESLLAKVDGQRMAEAIDKYNAGYEMRLAAGLPANIIGPAGYYLHIGESGCGKVAFGYSHRLAARENIRASGMLNLCGSTAVSMAGKPLICLSCGARLAASESMLEWHEGEMPR